VKTFPDGKARGWKNGRPSGLSISKFHNVLPPRSIFTPVAVFSILHTESAESAKVQSNATATDKKIWNLSFMNPAI
jgi:hypothetical protein